MKSVLPTTEKRAFTGRRGNPQDCQKCLAKTRRGTLCQRAAELNPASGKRKRCRLHGGLSTGARTPEGQARMAASKVLHGRYTLAAKQARRDLVAKLASLKSKTRGLA